MIKIGSAQVVAEEQFKNNENLDSAKKIASVAKNEFH
jgi:hypothetical protein